MPLLPALALTIASQGVALIAHEPKVDFPQVGKVHAFKVTDKSPFPFNEAIVSWNVSPAAGAHVSVEARAKLGDRFTKWYALGEWELDDANNRTSVKKEADADGDVQTDTLHLNGLASEIQLRVYMARTKAGPTPKLNLVTVSFSDTSIRPPSRNEPSSAWGKLIDVPQRAQGNYPDGSVLCSPTSLSMLLWHYANVLKQPELNHDVPEVRANVWDKAYSGAGNWPFNAAYAGSFPAITSYVTRFRGIQDLETWIDAGYPVICSVSLDLLKGQPKNRDSGHLVVLLGFEKNGDPIFNDPAWKDQVRRTYKRENFETAWLNSSRTVYIVHPARNVGTSAFQLPVSKDGVWFEPKSE